MSVITHIMPRAIKILFFISSDSTSTSLQGWLNYSVFSPTVEWDILHQVLRFLEYSRMILILSWVMPVSFILILDINHDDVHILSHFNWTSRMFPFNVVVTPHSSADLTLPGSFRYHLYSTRNLSHSDENVLSQNLVSLRLFLA